MLVEEEQINNKENKKGMMWNNNNNNKITKKKEKNQLSISIQFVYTVYTCLYGLRESVSSFDIRMDFVK